MTTDELAQIEIEMRAAFKRRKETREALTAAKGELDDRRADHRKACDAVDALVLQLGTGQRQATMPGFSEPANGHTAPLPPDPNQEMLDDIRQDDVEQSGPGEPDADLADAKAAWNGNGSAADQAARILARNRIFDFVSSLKTEIASQVRVCNKCDRPRIHSVAACTMCKSPEFRSVGQALRDLGVPESEWPAKLRHESGPNGEAAPQPRKARKARKEAAKS